MYRIIEEKDPELYRVIGKTLILAEDEGINPFHPLRNWEFIPKWYEIRSEWVVGLAVISLFALPLWFLIPKTINQYDKDAKPVAHHQPVRSDMPRGYSDDVMLVGTGPAWVNIADCDNGYLNYDTKTNTFSCRSINK